MAVSEQFGPAEFVIDVPSEKPNPEMLAYAYLRFQEQGLLSTVFHSTYPVIRLKQYLEWCEDKAILACYARRPILDTAPSLAGLGFVNQIQQVGDLRRVEVGVAFFREYQRYHLPEKFCEMMLAWTFRVAKADITYGVTPEHNRAMIRLARRMGFVQERIRGLVAWKGKACAGVVYSMTRKEWEVCFGRTGQIDDCAEQLNCAATTQRWPARTGAIAGTIPELQDTHPAGHL